jgi:hypothetical protein
MLQPCKIPSPLCQACPRRQVHYHHDGMRLRTAACHLSSVEFSLLCRRRVFWRPLSIPFREILCGGITDFRVAISKNVSATPLVGGSFPGLLFSQRDYLTGNLNGTVISDRKFDFLHGSESTMREWCVKGARAVSSCINPLRRSSNREWFVRGLCPCGPGRDSSPGPNAIGVIASGKQSLTTYQGCPATQTRRPCRSPLPQAQ